MKPTDNAYAVIIAGGEGRRLWPLSTPEFPKQFISVFGGKPLIRHAVDRLRGLIPPERTLVVTAGKFTALTRKALPHVPAENIVGEPCRRDTAGAVAIACALVKRLGGDDAVGCVMPADHLISPEKEFRRTLADAIAVAAKSDAVVTVGIRPDRPATEYGYIECGGDAGIISKTAFERVRKFVEKPDLRTARKYLASGRHIWNAGMFIWSVKTLEKVFAETAGDIADVITPLATAKNLKSTLKRIYPALRAISFDYAVLEKTKDILVARSSFSWDDVGSWHSLSGHFPTDADGNTVVGEAVFDGTANSVSLSPGGHIVAVAGLENVIVVNTPRATLVMSKSALGNGRRIVDKALESIAGRRKRN